MCVLKDHPVTLQSLYLYLMGILKESSVKILATPPKKKSYVTVLFLKIILSLGGFNVRTAANRIRKRGDSAFSTRVKRQWDFSRRN